MLQIGSSPLSYVTRDSYLSLQTVWTEKHDGLVNLAVVIFVCYHLRYAPAIGMIAAGYRMNRYGGWQLLPVYKRILFSSMTASHTAIRLAVGDVQTLTEWYMWGVSTRLQMVAGHNC